jgi:prepilin-type N-terminal cleavage/methylation domain-containing protein
MKFKQINIQNGFTLLEILVAIALFAAVAAMLYPAYIGTIKNIDTVESYADIYRMSRIAIERISEDLASADPPDTQHDSELAKSQAFVGKDASLESRNADELSFLSERHISFREPQTTAESEELQTSLIANQRLGRGLIKYSVEQVEGEDGFILYRSDISELGDQSADKAEKYVLCEGLYGINFTFQDANGESYDNWDSTSDALKGKLPVLVSVELEFINPEDPESPIKFDTAISIPLAKRTYGTNS